MRVRHLPVGILIACSALQTSSSSFHHRSDCPVAYAQLSLSFEPNLGQADPDAQFIARGFGYALRLAPLGATLPLNGDTLTLSLLRANADAVPEGFDERPAKANYFLGNDPTRWLIGVPTYSKVRYRSVYPGVDIVFYGDHQQLEYDLVLRPHANPRAITLRFDGATRAAVDTAGDLVLTMARTRGQVRQRRPVIYQVIGGQRRSIAGGYVVSAGNEVTFWVGSYDPETTLTIDPVIVYASAFGGSRGDRASAIAVDSQGNSYVTGATYSPDFPVSGTAVQRSLHMGLDAFVAKIDSSGKSLVYATYLGGNNGRIDYEAESEIGRAIAVDAAGNAYITGSTQSTDFPVVNAYQSQPQYNVSKGFDAFVAKLSPDGSALRYSTYLGSRTASTSGNGIAVDAIGNAYVGGATSGQFPTTTLLGPPGSRGTAFVAKFNPAGGFVYSSRLGGTSYEADVISSVAVDAMGQPHVVGRAASRDFPIVKGTLAACPSSGRFCGGGFLAKLSTSGSQLVYSTYLGGDWQLGRSGNTAKAVGLDAAGNAYVVGLTGSTTLATMKAVQATYGGGYSDIFVTSFSPNGALRYATYLGGGGWDGESAGIAVDPAGFAYVVGATESTNFPLLQPMIGAHPGGPVFRSVDGGARWRVASAGLNSSVKALALDRQTAGTMYAATRDGVFKTANWGMTWIAKNDGLLPTGDGDLATTSVAIDPAAPMTLYASTYSGTFTSVNGGDRWQLVDAESRAAEKITIDPAAPSTVFVGGVFGIRKTTDSGRTWANAGSGFIRDLVIDPAAHGTVYAVSSSSFASVSKSTNGGASWIPMNRGLTARYLTRLTMDPSDPRTLYASGDGVFKTTDAAATWARILSNDVHTVAVSPRQEPALYVSATGSDALVPCVQRSADGGRTWEPATEVCTETS